MVITGMFRSDLACLRQTKEKKTEYYLLLVVHQNTKWKYGCAGEYSIPFAFQVS